MDRISTLVPRRGPYVYPAETAAERRGDLSLSPGSDDIKPHTSSASDQRRDLPDISLFLLRLRPSVSVSTE